MNAPDRTEGARKLVGHLLGQGFDLWVEGDRLKCRSPGGAVPDDVRERLQEFKPEVIALLQAQAMAAADLAEWTGADAEQREVCIESPWGRVWIGPERTGKDRLEVTWRELHEDPSGTLARCRSIWDAIRIFDGRLVAGKGA